jgi:hypothetical protein
MGLVTAISYIDLSNGEVITVKGVEQYRIPYVPVRNADGTVVPGLAITLPNTVEVRVIHYFDPTTWRAHGNWSAGRHIQWTKPTTRPFEMWPKVWDGVSLPAERIAIAEWREEVKRRAVLDREAWKHKAIKDRSADPNRAQRVPGSRQMSTQALAATAFDFEAWKPWLGNLNKKLDLEIPDMPLQQKDLHEHLLPPKHRKKHADMPWNCCVARPVFKDEIRRSPGARAALRKEWDRLRLINTWREDLFEEWDAVKLRAKKSHTRVHVGMVFQICVEEDSGTEKPEHLRKYKGRVVFRSNDVVDENWDIAMFQELGSAPATMVAAKTCDLYGLREGHVIENADAAQAYAQLCWEAPRGLATHATPCLPVGESIIQTSRCRRLLGGTLRRPPQGLWI